MASIKNSLRKIYTALGGTSSKSKTITGLLDDISTVASSGGGGFPKVHVAVTYGATTTVVVEETFSELCKMITEGSVQTPIVVSQTITNSNATLEYLGSVVFNGPEEVVKIIFETNTPRYASTKFKHTKYTVIVDKNDNASYEAIDCIWEMG